jgi:hypothetical protein
MTVPEIFTALGSAGVTLRLTGPETFAASPKEAIAPELAEALAQHRWGVLAVLMLRDVWARNRGPGVGGQGPGRRFRRVG